MIEVYQIFGLLSLSIFISIIIIYYGYYKYITKFKTKNLLMNKEDYYSNITVIIPTYNEEKTIKNKLDNILEQTYPKQLTEILIIDSNSEDSTMKIVKNFIHSHPKLNINMIIESERKGKSQAINKAFSSADPKSEIIIMTDADALLKTDSIEKIISTFNDNKEIGAVCGTEVILNKNESNETMLEDSYRKYYKKLRLGESALDSTPIFDGELSAYRADIIKGIKIKENSNVDDCQLANIVRRCGYRSISCPDALFYEYAPPDWSSMMRQKVRRGQGLSRMFWYNKDMIFNRKLGKFGSVIFPVNFFMHVISPFLVLLALIFGFIFTFVYMLQNYYLLIPLISAIFIALLLKSFFLEINMLKSAWTFFVYQMILLNGMLLFISGRSLYKWQKVEKVRNKFQDHNIIKEVK